MDGDFMKKLMCWAVMIVLLVGLFQVGSLMADNAQLKNNLIRLHVVANSDSPSDQSQKLMVRDAIVDAVQGELGELGNIEEARAYLREKLPELEQIANQVLREAGSTAVAKVSLAVEKFKTRVYETFSLPSGVYESLRITIGEGKGQNWWCVVFPSLCLPATTEDFQDTAVSSGFSNELTDTLCMRDGYEIRFFFLDCLGRLENLFFSE